MIWEESEVDAVVLGITFISPITYYLVIYRGSNFVDCLHADK